RNGRRESDLSVKPWLDRMLVCGSDVGQVAGLERTNVRVHKFGGGGVRCRSGRLGISAGFLCEFPSTPADKQKYDRNNEPAWTHILQLGIKRPQSRPTSTLLDTLRDHKKPSGKSPKGSSGKEL